MNFAIGSIVLGVFIALFLTVIVRMMTRGVTSVPVIRNLIQKPLDLEAFNRKFVAANQTLALGNTEALGAGIGLLADSLECAGEFTESTLCAIRELRCAYRHHDRADTKGPWNRDLSGYGVIAWKNDLYDRDTALRMAWPYIDQINRELKSRGLGWNY